MLQDLPDNQVEFSYEGELIRFHSVSSGDHLLGIMRRNLAFYEQDVLERLRQRLGIGDRSGVAIDAGAYIGTHSVFLSRICNCPLVLSFEANPNTFPFLLWNIEDNSLSGRIIAVNQALGATAGTAALVSADPENQGAVAVTFKPTQANDRIAVTTIDDEIVRRADILVDLDVVILKIDVEGAELDVLRGARHLISQYRPILCVEVHEYRNLSEVLKVLGENRYLVIDCLGYSPTYIIESVRMSKIRRAMVNGLWLIRAWLPTGMRRSRWYLGRTAQVVGAIKQVSDRY